MCNILPQKIQFSLLWLWRNTRKVCNLITEQRAEYGAKVIYVISLTGTKETRYAQGPAKCSSHSQHRDRAVHKKLERGDLRSSLDSYGLEQLKTIFLELRTYIKVLGSRG